MKTFFKGKTGSKMVMRDQDCWTGSGSIKQCSWDELLEENKDIGQVVVWGNYVWKGPVCMPSVCEGQQAGTGSTERKEA